MGIKALLEAHRSVCKNDPKITMWPSVSDAGWLARGGIPTVIYGPGRLEQAHTVDEYIDLEDLFTVTKIYALTLLNWCGYSRN